MQKNKWISKSGKWFVLITVIISLISVAVYGTNCITGNTLLSFESGQGYSGGIGLNPICSEHIENATEEDGIMLVGLSNTTNAHAQNPYTHNYYSNIIYVKAMPGVLDISVNYRMDACDPGEEELFSLSNSTNAHIGDFSKANYHWKVCLAYNSCDPANFNNNNGFRIKNSNGLDLLAIDNKGMMMVRGNIYNGSNALPSPTSKYFKIEDINGNTAFWLDDSGNLYLTGQIFTNLQTVPITSNKELIIKKHGVAGEAVAVFNTDSGYLALRNCTVENYAFP